MLSLSLVNPQAAGGPPFDLAKIVQPVLALPALARPLVWHWNPGLATNPPEGGMVFDQGLTRPQIVAVQDTCAAAGSQWCPYIGGDYGVYPTNPQRRAVLEELRGCRWIGLDHTDSNSVGFSDELTWQACSLGFSIVIEANLKTKCPWIPTLAKRFRGQVGIMGEHWLWKGAEDGTMTNRYTVQQVRDMGAVPMVLVTRRVSGNDPSIGFPNVPENLWDEKKVELCQEWDAKGADVILRPAGMSVAQLATVGALNA